MIITNCMLDGWFASPGASEFCGRSTDPPPTSAPARDVIRAEFGEPDAPR
jgi:hypothetical protein